MINESSKETPFLEINTSDFGLAALTLQFSRFPTLINQCQRLYLLRLEHVELGALSASLAEESHQTLSCGRVMVYKIKFFSWS